MWRDGTLLVVRRGEEFPDRCVKSNRPAHGHRVRQCAERGFGALFLAHLCSPIATGLIHGSVTRHVTFAVGLSEERFRKRRRAFYVAGVIIFVSLATLAYGVILLGRGGDIGFGAVSLGVLSCLGGLLYGLNASTLVTAKRITKGYYWLVGVHPEFLAELPGWPGELWADLGSSPDERE